MEDLEKEKIILFIKDSLSFLLLIVIIYSLTIENILSLLLLYVVYFAIQLVFIYNFETKSLDPKKIVFSSKSRVFIFSLSTALVLIINYLIRGTFARYLNSENGIYFIVLHFLIILWYIIAFNWRR